LLIPYIIEIVCSVDVRWQIDYLRRGLDVASQKGHSLQVLEKEQRRATRVINECGAMTYEERLRMTGLTTLETRRLRADMVEVKGGQ